TGTVIQGETLLADASGVTDADGIDTTTISYQWLRDGVAISGATNHSYQLIQTDVGGGISVVFTYTDDFGTEENVVSDVTAPVDPLGMNLTGTPGDDDLSGNLSDDTIYGLDGDDRLIGDLGNDSLFAGDGNDTINGGEGDDTIFGGETTEDIRDIIYAGAGNDRVEAGFGNDLVFGMDGDDVIAGGFGADELQGQNGNDVITGSAFGDLIFGGDGDDFINGGYGFDLKNGGSGADRFYHEGDVGHGSDWVQDYMAAEGDILLFGFDFAEGSNFQVNFAHTENATGERSGDDSIMEAFVIFRPTGQIIWALVDGAGQSEINLRVSGSSEMFDLLG
ncbi:calcium-binding protein, partial [Shimia thalassica]|uniref:calcium-binding protein n=1 Tax=Shimia thalassica TaxID=1715693 RepID=UPI0027366E27